LKPKARKLKVAFLGGGNGGSAFARRAAMNLLHQNQNGGSSPFFRDVHVWVYEEIVGNRKLTDIINTDHMNPRYLPNVPLPVNLIADSSLEDTIINADIIFFVVPHQFLPSVLAQMKGLVKPTAIAVSLIKGLNVGPEGPKLLSQIIHDELNLVTDVAVLMGANVASEVANDEYVESTVACRNSDVSNLIAAIFHTDCMQIDTCTDVATIEICGAVKNIVAMGGGSLINLVHELLDCK
jgi:glycerol-3-phosphate dehydrogenase (NAD+)